MNANEEVLLIRKKGKIFWEQIGGKVEFGESLENAFIRESLEETGIVIQVVELLVLDQALKGKSEHWITFSFLANHVSGEPKILESHKHEELKWFPLRQLPENLSIYTKKALDTYMSKYK